MSDLSSEISDSERRNLKQFTHEVRAMALEAAHQWDMHMQNEEDFLSHKKNQIFFALVFFLPLIVLAAGLRYIFNFTSVSNVVFIFAVLLLVISYIEELKLEFNKRKYLRKIEEIAYEWSKKIGSKRDIYDIERTFIRRDKDGFYGFNEDSQKFGEWWLLQQEKVYNRFLSWDVAEEEIKKDWARHNRTFKNDVEANPEKIYK